MEDIRIVNKGKPVHSCKITNPLHPIESCSGCAWERSIENLYNWMMNWLMEEGHGDVSTKEWNLAVTLAEEMKIIFENK